MSLICGADKHTHTKSTLLSVPLFYFILQLANLTHPLPLVFTSNRIANRVASRVHKRKTNIYADAYISLTSVEQQPQIKRKSGSNRACIFPWPSSVIFGRLETNERRLCVDSPRHVYKGRIKRTWLMDDMRCAFVQRSLCAAK